MTWRMMRPLRGSPRPAHDGTVGVWNLNSKTQLLSLGPVGSSISSIDFSPDGARLVTSHGDGAVKLWNAADGTQDGPIVTRGKSACCSRFSPDGTHIAAAIDSKLLLIEVGSKRVVTEYEFGHRVYWLDFSPDGSHVAIAPVGPYFEWIELATEKRSAPGDCRIVITCRTYAFRQTASQLPRLELTGQSSFGIC